MWDSTDSIVDKIISILKEHLPAQLDTIDTALADVRAGVGGQEDCYYFGIPSYAPTVYPAVSVRVREEDFTHLDQGHETPFDTLLFEIELACAGEYEQTVERDCVKYARAIKEILNLHKSLDSTVAMCEVRTILYSNPWQNKEGGNLYKAFIMEIQVKKV